MTSVPLNDNELVLIETFRQLPEDLQRELQIVADDLVLEHNQSIREDFHEEALENSASYADK